MRAPWRESPYWGWDDFDPHTPDTPPVLTVIVDEEEGECLVDPRGEPIFTEEPPCLRFGFCSQKEKDD